MKPIMYTIPLLALIGVCSCSSKVPSLSTKAYVLKMAFVEGSAETIDDHCKLMSQIVDTKTKGVKVTEFPLVYFDLGDDVKNDQMEYREFPERYDDNGKPTVFSKGGIGKKITVHCKGSENGTINIDLHAISREFLGWDTTFANEKGDFLTPMFEVRELETDLSLRPGEWCFLGGTNTRSNGGAPPQALRMAVQVLAQNGKSNKNSHDHADAGHGK